MEHHMQSLLVFSCLVAVRSEVVRDEAKKNDGSMRQAVGYW